MALQKQIVNYPLGVGVDTKTDERALEAPSLSVCINGQFEELGGIQTRKPFVSIDNSTSNTLTDIRRLTSYEDELLAFTKGALWSYAEGDGTWTQRAEYLAVKVDEQPRFVKTSEQFNCDRAQLDGVVMYCWTETTPSGTDNFYAAIDAVTGTVKLAPTSLGSVVSRCRLTATTNKILLTYYTGSELSCRAFDPSDLSYVGGTDLTIGNANYDVMQHNAGNKLLGVVRGASGYSVFEVSEAGTYSTLASRVVTLSGAVAIAQSDSTTDRIYVAYNNGTAVKSDQYNYAGSSQSTDTAVGTASSSTVNQMTAIWSASASKFLHFWGAGESVNNSLWSTEYNTVNSSGTADTEADVVRGCGIASRAFYHDSAVYLWVVFAGQSSVGTVDAISQLQNTYFLYRSDGQLIAKAAPNTAEGFHAVTGYLPQVEDLGSNKWAWAGCNRRIVPLGQSQKGYAAKSLQDITFEFDSNDARRTVQLGDTLYIVGGMVFQYDGLSVTEVGFNTFPYSLGVVQGGVGSSLNGTYNWQQSFSWYNAKGEFERSTTATIFDANITSTDEADCSGDNLHVTAKTGTATGEVAIEYWRQVVSADVGQPFYLVTSKDPAASGDNGYEENDPTSATGNEFTDDLADADLISRELWGESGGLILENLPPPSASIIHATQDRVLLAGIPANPYRVNYSKLRAQGEIASFHDSLYVDLPPEGGAITAIDFLNETLIIFKERAVYALPGDGFDNAGGGQNYGPARVLANDVGAISADTVALTPRGLVFKSHKGWYLLNRGWSANYIGGPVADFDGDTFTSVHTIEDQHQVRCCSTDRVLVWDYLVGQWSEWDVSDLVHSVLHNGAQHYASDAGEGDNVMAQEATWANNTTAYGLDLETAWLKTSGLQGFQRIWEIMLLGEYLSDCSVRVRVAYDYDNTWVDDKTWTPDPATVGAPLQFYHSPTRQKCQAIKVRITARNAADDDAPTGEAFKLTGIQLTYGMKRNRFKNMPKARKQ